MTITFDLSDAQKVVLRRVDCPAGCHNGFLYHGDPADPMTDVEECEACDSGRTWFYLDGSGAEWTYRWNEQGRVYQREDG